MVAATAAAERAKAEREAIEQAAALAQARDKRLKELDLEAADRRDDLREAEQALARIKADTSKRKRLYELEHGAGSVGLSNRRCLGAEYVRLAGEYRRLKEALPGLKTAHDKAKAAARVGTTGWAEQASSSAAAPLVSASAPAPARACL
jgi:hypothetical protein